MKCAINVQKKVVFSVLWQEGEFGWCHMADMLRMVISSPLLISGNETESRRENLLPSVAGCYTPQNQLYMTKQTS